jgi:S-adenosylmethionine:tRNA ribosyltransferase-isomerase
MNRTEFLYDLPDKQIAKHPVNPRHNSKLLQHKHGTISHHSFLELDQLIPEKSQLVMNNAKVIPARIHCQKPTGASIEIFLLEPIDDYETCFSATDSCQWHVLVGNKKRWKEGSIFDISNRLEIRWVDRENNTVELKWKNGTSFSSLVESIGQIPIPPYLNRKNTAQDSLDYQTMYAKIAGSVAAPTAGLHFTKEVMARLSKKDVNLVETTLHVGAGTFKPVESENILEHNMHSERFEVRLEQVKSLMAHSAPRFAVGTTSLRVLESLYLIGSKIKLGKANPFIILQNDAPLAGLSYSESLEILAEYLEVNGDQLAATQIFIYPGKKVSSIDGLITNFHQPGSSLLMLIATCIGKDWKRVYSEALKNQYRFLSYGDSSLLWLI